jgi:uncharacterized membrane protein YadS
VSGAAARVRAAAAAGLSNSRAAAVLADAARVTRIAVGLIVLNGASSHTHESTDNENGSM